MGLSEQDPKDELRIELDRGLANQLGISMRCRAGAARRLRRRGSRRLGGSDWRTRDVAVRLHPDDRVDASNIEHLPVAVAGSNMMVPLEQIATITLDKGPAQIQHLDGKRTVTVSANVQGVDAGRSHRGRDEDRESIDFPEGYGLAWAALRAIRKRCSARCSPPSSWGSGSCIWCW